MSINSVISMGQHLDLVENLVRHLAKAWQKLYDLYSLSHFLCSSIHAFSSTSIKIKSRAPGIRPHDILIGSLTAPQRTMVFRAVTYSFTKECMNCRRGQSVGVNLWFAIDFQ